MVDKPSSHKDQARPLGPVETLPPIGSTAVYSPANALWTEQELQLLRKGLEEFPPDKYDNITRYIKIAAEIPTKGVRDVAYKIRYLNFSTTKSIEETPTENINLNSKRARIDNQTKQQACQDVDIAESKSVKDEARPEDDTHVQSLLRDNLVHINTMRSNVLEGKFEENRSHMSKFRNNYQAVLNAIGHICDSVPQLSLQLDLSLLAQAAEDPVKSNTEQ